MVILTDYIVYNELIVDIATGQVWNHLVIKAANKPVSGNMDGSYLTFFSSNGLTFGIINIIGNFGTVFCDQAYWVCSELFTSSSWRLSTSSSLCCVCCGAVSSWSRYCLCIPFLFAYIFFFTLPLKLVYRYLLRRDMCM